LDRILDKIKKGGQAGLKVVEKMRPAGSALRALNIVIFFALLLGSACTTTEAPEFKGGVLATFDVQGERFSIFITNPETIEQVYALSKGESDARIPSGRLLRGQVSYNKPWHWHIDSQDIAMAHVTMELCDGRPSDVENNSDYWIDSVGRFCPWSAQLVVLNDYR
jgi:hypothetical protein